MRRMWAIVPKDDAFSGALFYLYVSNKFTDYVIFLIYFYTYIIFRIFFLILWTSF